MHEITFTVPGAPVGKARPRVARFGTYTPETTVLYENLVKVEFVRQCGHCHFAEGPMQMQIDAYYPIPKGTSKKDRAEMLGGELRPTKKPDWDNIGKIISDALNGVAYGDDSRIVDCRVIKQYAEKPCVKVTLGLIVRED